MPGSRPVRWMPLLSAEVAILGLTAGQSKRPGWRGRLKGAVERSAHSRQFKEIKDLLDKELLPK